MTLFHFVRHGAHVLQDRAMVGRSPGIALSGEGRAQAARTVLHFGDAPLDAVVSSPRRRARETAAIIAAATNAPCEIAAGLDEIDFGEWTGRTLHELAHDPRWHLWNTARRDHRCPGGESMEDVWTRVSATLSTLHRRWPDGVLALVTHAEPIRAAVLVAGGRSFDEFAQIQVAPGSVSTLCWRGGALHPVTTDIPAAA